MPKLRRCTYNDLAGRCRRAGYGNPALCGAHETAEDDPVANILNNPAVQNTLNKFQSILDSAAGVIDRARAFVPPTNHAQEAPRRPTNDPPRPQRPPRPTNEDPRNVLGFGPHVKLTVEVIKERRKELAKLFHPDHSGSPEAMRKVNAAADALLGKLK